MNSSTSFDTHMLTIKQCVKFLIVRESINTHCFTYTGHRSLCQCFKCSWIHEQALIDIYWPPTTVSRVLNLREFTNKYCYIYTDHRTLCQGFKINIREFINKYWYTYTDHRTLCQGIKCTWIHKQALIYIHWPPNTVSRC